MQAKIWEGIAERIDFVRVRRPPEDPPFKEKGVYFIIQRLQLGKRAHLGSLESDRGRPR
jgi:hypothetical protein